MSFLSKLALMRPDSFWIALPWFVWSGFMIIELARLCFLDNTLYISRCLASLARIGQDVLLLSNLPSLRQSITEWLLIFSSRLERIDVTKPTSLKDRRIQWVPESRSSTTNITILLLLSCDPLGLADCCLIWSLGSCFLRDIEFMPIWASDAPEDIIPGICCGSILEGNAVMDRDLLTESNLPFWDTTLKSLNLLILSTKMTERTAKLAGWFRHSTTSVQPMSTKALIEDCFFSTSICRGLSNSLFTDCTDFLHGGGCTLLERHSLLIAESARYVRGLVCMPSRFLQ